MYAIAVALVIGVVVRALVAGRDAYGLTLVPAVAAAATAAVWAVVVWFGWDAGVGWTWALSIGAGAIAAILVAWLLPRSRAAADERYFEAARRA